LQPRFHLANEHTIGIRHELNNATSVPGGGYGINTNNYECLKVLMVLRLWPILGDIPRFIR
ncbi:MAG: hypothetical protein WBG91_06965, partial [Syntrophobacteria bacterium]